jgi:ribosomal protein S6
MPADKIEKAETTLNITDEVIRFLITKPDLKAIAKAEAKKKEKEEIAAKRSDEKEESDESEEE